MALTVPHGAALLNPVPGFDCALLNLFRNHFFVSQRLCYIQLPDPQLSVRLISANWVPPVPLCGELGHIRACWGTVPGVRTVHSTVTRRRRCSSWNDRLASLSWRKGLEWSWMLSWNAGSGKQSEEDVPLVCPDYQCYWHHWRSPAKGLVSHHPNVPPSHSVMCFMFLLLQESVLWRETRERGGASPGGMWCSKGTDKKPANRVTESNGSDTVLPLQRFRFHPWWGTTPHVLRGMAQRNRGGKSQ